MSKILIVFIFIILILSTTIQSSFYSDLYTDLYKDVKQSVVLVQANNSQNEPLAQGTGFFINKTGDIITNFHVINGSNKINVTTAEGYTYQVKNILAKDISSDLACLSVDIPSQMVYPIKMNTTPPEVGEEILVIGYPEGPGGLAQSMTQGIVSSVQTLNEYGEVIQIDAAVSPGASGSPLVNMKREAIGVTTFGYIKGQNQNFAVSYMQVSKLIHGISQAQNISISEWILTSEEDFYARGIDLCRRGEYNQSIYYLDKAIELNPRYTDAQLIRSAALYNLEFNSSAINVTMDKPVEPVSNETLISGNFSGKIPLNHYIWILVNPSKAPGIWYPQGANHLAFTSGINKKWIWQVRLNWEPDQNVHFTIAAALVDNQTDQEFLNWLKNGNETKIFPGLKLPETARLLNSIIVRPSSEIDWNKRGDVLYEQGKYYDAIQAYEKAIEFNSQSYDAWCGKGDTFCSLGKYYDAIQAYDEAKKIYPNGYRAKLGEGLANNALYEEAKPKGIPEQERNDNWNPGYHWP
jgi:tetratricopeptide (TPR) repeat protein